jgi:uncharacterized protein YbjT (DUF2867 family)
MAAFLVLGSTGAIGSSTAKLLRARGDSVLIAGRDPTRLVALGVVGGLRQLKTRSDA